ncbi:MAG: DUF58 domain-containing protein [Elusimicrobiota bacterium]
MSLKYLETTNLLKLSSLALRAKYVVEGMVSGLHRSRCRGHSIEFTQHREYAYGDEIRHIDWKVFGRTDKFFIKQYEEETNLRAYILMDISKSMNYVPPHRAGFPERPNKLEYARILVATLAYLLLHQEDSVGLLMFDDTVRRFIPPRSQIKQFSSVVSTLENTAPGNKTDLSRVILEFSKFLKKRGLVVFVSDLMDSPENVMRSIKLLRYKHHDVIVFQIIDPAERELGYSGPVIFESLESAGEKIHTEVDDIKEEYKINFNRFINEYKVSFHKSGIDYCLLTTDTPIELGLGTFLYSNRS